MRYNDACSSPMTPPTYAIPAWSLQPKACGMTIRIVTDSTCDLPSEILSQYGLRVVPLYINFGTQSYLDGIDLTREEFYARLPHADPAPTTAVPGQKIFGDTYQALVDQGATEILSIHVSSKLSGVVNAAQLAARTASVPVTVFDSGTLSLGTGLLAVRAAQAAAQGYSMDEIVALLQEQAQRTYVFATLETLEYLRRSGRMSRVMAATGSILRIKLLLKMHDGDATAERMRTSKAATRRLLALLEEQLPVERVALVHTHEPAQAQQLYTQVSHMLPAEEILSVDITPIFGTHLGPGAVGFVCVRAREEPGKETS